MPNGMRDEDNVTWGRFEAVITNVRDRLAELEKDEKQRAGRTWAVLIAVFTGLILPMVGTIVLTVTHIIGHG